MGSDLAVGALHSLSLFLWSWGIGFPIGFGVAVLAFLVARCRWAVSGLATVFTAMPLLAVLFWIHYPFQTMLRVVWPPTFTAVLVLTFFVGIAVSDTVLQSMLKVDRRYLDVVAVLGIRRGAYLQRALIPSALALALPRLLTLAVSSIHLTMFASLIGVEELFRVVQRLNAQYLRPVELYSLMAVAYLVLCLPLHLLAARIEQRLAVSGHNDA